MKLQSSHKVFNSVNDQVDIQSSKFQSNDATVQLSERTFGQKLADKLASKVGSWGFLIGQTTVLTAWVGCNLTPGMPHWDESPFILLNLVFSFASAYTAPVVLMSQNRQSEEDREQALQNHQINLQTAQNLELLHQKMDALYSEKLAELTELIQQQAAQSSVAQQVTQQAQTGSSSLKGRTASQQFNYVGFLPSNIAPAQQAAPLPMVDLNLFTHTIQTEDADSPLE